MEGWSAQRFNSSDGPVGCSTETFKLSTDQLPSDQVRAIVGRYMQSPPHVLRRRELPESGAGLHPPVLPLCPGPIEGRTHADRRQGTTLLAALDLKTRELRTP